MEEGVFPHARALDEGGLEEERRLGYVGITRAMRELYLTSARRRDVFGATQYGMRSRFLDEIPAELTDRPADARGAPGGRRRGAAAGVVGVVERARGRRRPSTSGSATTSCTRRSARAS